MNNRKIKYQTLFSKWLLAVVLLLSFFTFSVTAISSHAKQNSAQTEAANAAQRQAVKSISYKRALKPAHPQLYTQSILSTSTIDLACFHSLMAKINIGNSNDKIIGRLQNSPHYQYKLLPQNKSDEPAIALV